MDQRETRRTAFLHKKKKRKRKKREREREREEEMIPPKYQKYQEEFRKLLQDNYLAAKCFFLMERLGIFENSLITVTVRDITRLLQSIAIAL